jgi:hypothetical protein
MSATRGRPSLFDPAYCDMVIEHMAKGHSLTSFAGVISVEPRTVERWAQDGGDQSHPEFCRAVKVGRAKAVIWWEERARAVASGEDGNATMVIFGLKNRAKDDWADMTKTELSGEVRVNQGAREVLAKQLDTRE